MISEDKNVRAVLLLLSMLTYLLMGAVVFEHLEMGTELELRAELAHIRERLVAKYGFSERDWELLETTIVKGAPHRAGRQWNFRGALYFALVVITTVGYGHSTPETPLGRAFCIGFAALGIPLGLVMFQSIGERVNTVIATVIEWIKDPDEEGTPTSWRTLLFVSLSIGFFGVFVGTLVFAHQEGWSHFEAFYYCVITLSTIGMGDYVACQRTDALDSQLGYFIFTLLFITAGLAVFSACVNLLVVSVMAPNADVVTAAEQAAARVRFEQLGDGDSVRSPKGRDDAM